MNDSYSFEVGSDCRLIISVCSADVDVYPTDGAIVVSMSGKTEEITVSQAGNSVSVISDKRTSFFSSPSVRISAGVPPGCDLEISGASVDVVARQRLGSVNAKTASGSLRMGDVGMLHVKSASGDVRFESVEGDCDCSVASGDVVGEVVTGDLRASLASGNVRIGRVGGSVRVKSVSGDTQIDRVDGNDVTVKSMSGDIRIGLPGGRRVDFELDALSGDIVMPKPPSPPDPMQPTEPPGSPDSRTHVYFQAKTVSGDITLERAD